MVCRVLRIGILGDQFINWGGGVDFLRLVCGSLAATQSAIDIHVLFPVKGPLYRINATKLTLKQLVYFLLGRPGGVVDTPNLDQIQRHLLSATGSVTFHQIDIGSFSLEKACRKLNLDVLLPSIRPLPAGHEVPWIGYLYDMQHKHLPHLFSANEIKKRNFNFKEMVDRSQMIMVNSKSVVNDLVDSFPGASEKIFSLPFSPAPSCDWFQSSDVDFLEKYRITNPYFIVCNQFWKHKDHVTGIKAFSEFLKKYPNVDLVCTGATFDYRDPAYFDYLKKMIFELGIDQKVRILGLIPKTDQIALMRASLALIQPTLFEGGPGGGAVYDAVGLGVPCIVSDIDVNREIDEDTVRFFKTGDASDLFMAMDTIYQNRFDRTEVDSAELLARGQARWRSCGEVLLNSIYKLLKYK